jgi:hypothetical protein
MVKTMATDDKDFLARWSRRKQAAREGLGEPEPDASQPPAETETAEAAAPETSEAACEDAFADVDFEALDYGSDYTRFMGKDVPEMVQRRALRALWRSDPVLANVDGLNDYDEDFTNAARAVEHLVTAYKTGGQGYRTDEEMAALEAEDKAEAEARAARQSDETESAEVGSDNAEANRAAREDAGPDNPADSDTEEPEPGRGPTSQV